jgi:hypothetical protein
VRTSGEDGFLQRCEALALTLRTREVFSHDTAARLWGMPLPREWSADEPVHVSVAAPDRARSGRNVIGHQISHPELHRRGLAHGLPVLDPVSVWVQLGGRVAPEWLVAAGDYLVRIPPFTTDDRRPFARIDDLTQAAWASSSPGARAARRMAALVREGSDSPRESELRVAIVRAGLPEPELAAEIRGETGEFVARVDMLYRRHAVVVEYDGDQHRTDARQYDRDVSRVDALYALGFHVVRIRKPQMRAGAAEATALVARALARAENRLRQIDPKGGV